MQFSQKQNYLHRFENQWRVLCCEILMIFYIVKGGIFFFSFFFFFVVYFFVDWATYSFISSN